MFVNWFLFICLFYLFIIYHLAPHDDNQLCVSTTDFRRQDIHRPLQAPLNLVSCPKETNWK